MQARLRDDLLVAELDRARRGQIKSRERVRDLAEVYTHEREVNAMLDLVPDMFPSVRNPGNIDCTFLEPSCGHGNFLVEIMSRKLKHVTPRLYGRGERFEHRVLRCVASIYGIDICDDNVRESRDRIRLLIAAHIQTYLGPTGPTSAFGGAVEAILDTNVIRADTLAAAASIEVVEYRAGRHCTFRREWSHLDSAANTPDLLSPSLVCDAAPIHYSRLRENPGPVAHDYVETEAA